MGSCLGFGSDWFVVGNFYEDALIVTVIETKAGFPWLFCLFFGLSLVMPAFELAQAS